MKVKYKGESTTYGLEKDEIYEVISIENKFYRIVDKSNEDYLYSKNFFEIVEETPTPLIIK